jgi:hypothetical protein
MIRAIHCAHSFIQHICTSTNYVRGTVANSRHSAGNKTEESVPLWNLRSNGNKQAGSKLVHK